MLRLPEQPYPGLRYFENEDALVFAGRKTDVIHCANRLVGCNVLVLHGRTGCGKSSFLRAGLRPALQKAQLSFRLAEDADLRVVRSGARPARTIANELYSICQDIAGSDTSTYGAGDRAAVLHYLAGQDRESFVRAASASAGSLVTAVVATAACLKDGVKPILVVDQAEEIYTLAEAELQADLLRDGGTPQRAGKVLKADQSVYFNFLVRAANGELGGVRLIISLRTEYKGQLDDDCAQRGSITSSHGMAGYYLDDLDVKGLAAAIRRPTLTREKLAQELELSEEATQALESPVEKYGFHFAEGVPEEIARRALSDGVPQGGRLPAVQIACLRMYQHLRRENRIHFSDTISSTIYTPDVNRMGSAANQVSEYLRECLESAVRGAFADRRTAAPAEAVVRFPDVIECWYEGLQHLKRLEPDGRATTAEVTRASLEKHIVQALEAPGRHQDLFVPLVGATLDKLGKDNILRCGVGGADAKCSLGHDSLALALNNWKLTYGQSRDNMMKAGMSSPRSFATLTQAELFAAEDTPPRHVITVPGDYMWDHQLPHFAQMKGFTERLGITFARDPALDVVGKARTKYPNWKLLRDAIESIAGDSSGNLTLVANDFHNFPSDQLLGLYTDILVTDLFLGSCLVGPILHAIPDELSDNDRLDDGNRQGALGKSLQVILNGLQSIEDLRIHVYGNEKETAIAFFELACTLAGMLPAQAAWVKKINFEVEKDTSYSRRDALFEKLVAGSAEGMTGRYAPNQFMFGTAYGRALAKQAGFRVYFSAQHLVDLADRAIRTAVAKGERRPDIVVGVQETLLHTLWQVNISPTYWRNSENRSLILRLAAIGYFTMDYVRSCPDDFVVHLFDFVNNTVLCNGDEAVAGMILLSRDEIRESVRASFDFLLFDEYPRTVFNLESTRAYYWRRSSQGRRQDKSVAHEIYLELCRLRAATLEYFEAASRHLTFLRQTLRPGALSDSGGTAALAPEVRQLHRSALGRIERAWRNYRIHNYLDAEVMMRRASDDLQRVVDHVQKRVATQAVK